MSAVGGAVVNEYVCWDSYDKYSENLGVFFVNLYEDFRTKVVCRSTLQSILGLSRSVDKTLKNIEVT